VGFYGEQVLPRFTDRICGDRHLDPLRRRVCADASGQVLELGFGSGTNVPFYPPSIAKVRAVEPSAVAWRLAQERVSASPIPIERVALDGERLPFPDGVFDSAISTFTLCTIPDASAALREVRRVLVDGGRLYFLEHGLAPDASVQRWQRRLEPLQKRMAGGCHLTRRIPQLISAAGLEVQQVETFYLDRGPRVGGACVLGIAVRT
jgi:ubiquinone/menaquinone biosynthesis C-methylase UbiE